MLLFPEFIVSITEDVPARPAALGRAEAPGLMVLTVLRSATTDWKPSGASTQPNKQLGKVTLKGRLFYLYR